MIKISNKSSDFSIYSCQPNDKNELIQIIDERIKEQGPNCDLNDIDVSQITDMSLLFNGLKFTGKFTGDISKWDVSNVNDMFAMFAYSDFNGNISDWNVSKVKNISYMFKQSHFNGDISKWNVRNVTNMSYMFYKAKFNGDISKWKISKLANVAYMFDRCPIKDEYKPKL